VKSGDWLPKFGQKKRRSDWGRAGAILISAPSLIDSADSRGPTEPHGRPRIACSAVPASEGQADAIHLYANPRNAGLSAGALLIVAPWLFGFADAGPWAVWLPVVLL
jgi:hypothetical protein